MAQPGLLEEPLVVARIVDVANEIVIAIKPPGRGTAIKTEPIRVKTACGPRSTVIKTTLLDTRRGVLEQQVNSNTQLEVKGAVSSTNNRCPPLKPELSEGSEHVDIFQDGTGKFTVVLKESLHQ